MALEICLVALQLWRTLAKTPADIEPWTEHIEPLVALQAALQPWATLAEPLICVVERE